jgi:RNA polymerase sigma-70 factor (ECF subfamily)
MPTDPFADLEPLVQSVYGYVAYRIGDGAEAESVTARTFDQAFRHRTAFGPGDRSLPWLIGLARHILSAEELAPPAPAVSIPEPRRTPVAAVEQLSADERELVALRFGAGLTEPEIAALTGLDEGAVEAGLDRALAQLESVLP